MYKPHFGKIRDIKPNKHCYNIYGKIIEVKHSTTILNSGDNLEIAEGYIADDSA